MSEITAQGGKAIALQADVALESLFRDPRERL
jgi:hypothetical protein